MDREFGAVCLMWVWTPHWGPHSQKQLRKQSFGGLGATWGWGQPEGLLASVCAWERVTCLTPRPGNLRARRSPRD